MDFSTQHRTVKSHHRLDSMQSVVPQGDRDDQGNSFSNGGGKKVDIADNAPVQVSEQDDRLYRHITLPNQMQVLLIQDAETDKEAAAMDVRVGQTSDPPYLQGTAHFCEHMLFMGTEKYPDENAYNEYLNDNGGNSNAFTSDENTNYYFDVSAGHLEDALDIFSRFFIDPLFTESATGRELNAIDNENSKNLMSDPWRLVQLLKAVSSTEHPWHQFGTGNAKTLGEDPKKAGVDIRAELLKFHARYYSANLMRLVVLGRSELDELQRMVVEKFHPVVNTKAPLPSFGGKVPFGPSEVGRRLNVVPVKDLREVMMTWPLPPIDRLFYSKPDGYLAHMAGHEGKGSLLSLLKKKGWANGLSAGPYESATDWSNFVISVDCTESGMEHVNDIIRMTYQYLNMIREDGLQEWIHLETKAIAEMNFRFSSKGNPMSYVSRLAGNMQIFPPELSVAGPSLLYNYDPEIVRELLDRLVPSNMLVVVIGKEFKGTTDKVEPWYGTEYSCEPLSEELLQSWTTCGQHPDIHIPEPNPVIATDFELRPPPPHITTTGPTLLRGDDSCRLWYRADGTFRKPKLNVRIRLATPTLYDSPESSVMGDLLMNLLKEDLNEELYMARQAGLGLDLFISKDALNVSLGGYNHKMKVLLDRCVKHMANFAGTLKGGACDEEAPGGNSTQVNGASDKNRKNGHSSLDLFLRVRQKVRKRYKNLRFGPPYQHAMFATLCCVEVPKWSNEDKLAAIEGPNVGVSAMQAFIPRLLSMVHVEMLVHGNATATEALELASIVSDGLAARPLPPYLWPECRVVDLSPRIAEIVGPICGDVGDAEESRTVRSTSFSSSENGEVAAPSLVPNGSMEEAEDDAETEAETEAEAEAGAEAALTPKAGASENIVVGNGHPGTTGLEYQWSQGCPNPEEANSAVEITFQVCLDEMRGRALLGLVTHLIKDKCFNQLRTKEQLGYLVWSGGSVHGGHVYNARFVVQSNDRSPRYLDERVEAFLVSFRETVATMTPEVFATNVQAVVDLILEKDKNLNQETARYWEEITCRAYMFDRDVNEANEVATLTIPEILEFYDRHFMVGGERRRKLACWVHGNQHPVLSACSRGADRKPKENVEGEEGGGRGAKGGKEALPLAADAVDVQGHDTRKVIMIEDYNVFKRSMPLLPLRKLPASAALKKPSKL